MSAWWDEPISTWATALGFDYRVSELTTMRPKRPVGSWWRENGNWKLQLEQPFYIEMVSFTHNEAVRRALTWTIEQAYERHMQANSNRIENIFLQLQKASDEQLVQSLSANDAVSGIPSSVISAPGYLFWIRYESSDRCSASEAPELRQGVEAIVDAFHPHAWRTWIALEENLESLLFYVPVAVLAEQESAESREWPSSELAVLREMAESFVAMVASDLLTNSRVAISCRVNGKEEIYRGLVSLVLANRASHKNSESARIFLFGAKPMLHLLQLLGSTTRFAFLQLVSSRMSMEQVGLPPDLQEALAGLVSSNLNVSEAARSLYLHRNTLINRIERIKALTGYDIRNFHDAMTLWVAVHLEES